MRPYRLRGLCLAAAALAITANGVVAQPCEPYWSDQFPSAYLNRPVYAMTVFDDGSGSGEAFYVAGNFTTVGSLELGSIAKLTGNTWSPLGAGVNGGMPEASSPPLVT